MILPALLDQLGESIIKIVQLKNFCLAVETTCHLAEKVKETGSVNFESW